jgi:hypothetical protein
MPLTDFTQGALMKKLLSVSALLIILTNFPALAYEAQDSHVPVKKGEACAKHEVAADGHKACVNTKEEVLTGKDFPVDVNEPKKHRIGSARQTDY